LTGKAPYKSANSQFLDADHSLPMVADEKAH